MLLHFDQFPALQLGERAGFGDEHFKVDKLVDGARTMTHVAALDHEARVQELAQMLGASGVTICSGPQVPRTGGFILMNAASKAEALEIMKNDPYSINGVAEYSVIEFEVKSFADAFSVFLK